MILAIFGCTSSVFWFIVSLALAGVAYWLSWEVDKHRGRANRQLKEAMDRHNELKIRMAALLAEDSEF